MMTNIILGIINNKEEENVVFYVKYYYDTTKYLPSCQLNWICSVCKSDAKKKWNKNKNIEKQFKATELGSNPFFYGI